MNVATRAWPFLTAFGGAVAGAVVGAWLVGTESPRRDTAAGAAAVAFDAFARPGAPQASASLACAPAPAIPPETLRALAAEIATLVSASAAARPTPTPAAVTTSPDALAARDEVERLLDGALAVRQWTDREALALRPLLGRLVERDHDEVVLALVRAINEGRLAVLTDGPPF